MSWDSPGGMDATGIEYWLDDDARAMMPPDSFFFIVNCNSDAGLVTFGAGDLASPETIPFGPSSHELPAAKSGVGSETVIVAGVTVVESDQVLWGLDEGGVLDITGFDAGHIAGTFEFSAIDVLGGTDGKLTVSGTFEYRNPG